MYTTIKEKVGMLILVMLLICGAVNAQHWRHYCYYPSNRIVTVVVKPDMLHYISNRFNRKERLAMAMAYLKTNKYLTIKQYAKMTQLSRAAAEAELDAFAMDKKNPIQLVIRGKKKIYTKRYLGYENDLETTDAGSDSLVFAAILCDCTQVSSSPSPQALYGH